MDIDSSSPNTKNDLETRFLMKEENEREEESLDLRERISRLVSDFRLKKKLIRDRFKGQRKIIDMYLQDQIWSAACWRNWQLQLIDKEVDLFRDQANSEALKLASQTKEQILSELSEQRMQLLSTDKEKKSSSNPIPKEEEIQERKKRLRSGTKKEESTDPLRSNGLANTNFIPTSKKRRGQICNNSLGIPTLLSDQMITEDISAIIPTNSINMALPPSSTLIHPPSQKIIGTSMTSLTGGTGGTGGGNHGNKRRNANGAPPTLPLLSSATITNNGRNNMELQIDNDFPLIPPLPLSSSSINLPNSISIPLVISSNSNGNGSNNSDFNNIIIEGGTLWYLGLPFRRGQSVFVQMNMIDDHSEYHGEIGKVNGTAGIVWIKKTNTGETSHRSTINSNTNTINTTNTLNTATLNTNITNTLANTGNSNSSSNAENSNINTKNINNPSILTEEKYKITLEQLKRQEAVLHKTDLSLNFTNKNIKD